MEQAVGRQGAARLGRPGDPEVEDLHGAGEGDHDVVGADVAVDDADRRAVVVALVVGVGEAGRGLMGDVGGDHRRDPLAAAGDRVEEAHQVDALDQLHRQVEVAVDLAEVEDLDDVGVVEAEGDLRLVDEHPRVLGLIGAVAADLLDHEALGEALTDGDRRRVDLGHAPLTDLSVEGVAAELLGEGTHRAGRKVDGSPGRGKIGSCEQTPG